MALLLLCSLVRAEDSSRAMAQAVSVGAWEAAWEAKGIEVRDATNQVVSRDSLVRGLRQGGAAMEREAASLSALKALAFLLDYLDRLGLGAALRCPNRPQSGRCDSVAVSLRELKLRMPQAGAWSRTVLQNDYFIPTENGKPCLAAGLTTQLRC